MRLLTNTLFAVTCVLALSAGTCNDDADDDSASAGRTSDKVGDASISEPQAENDNSHAEDVFEDSDDEMPNDATPETESTDEDLGIDSFDDTPIETQNDSLEQNEADTEDF